MQVSRIVLLAAILCFSGSRAPADTDDRKPDGSPVAPQHVRAFLMMEKKPHVKEKHISEWETCTEEFDQFMRIARQKDDGKTEQIQTARSLLDTMGKKISADNPFQIQLCLYRNNIARTTGTPEDLKKSSLFLLNQFKKIRDVYESDCPAIDHLFAGKAIIELATTKGWSASESKNVADFMNCWKSRDDAVSKIRATAGQALAAVNSGDYDAALQYVEEHFALRTIVEGAQSYSCGGDLVDMRIAFAHNRFLKAGRKDLALNLTDDISMETLGKKKSREYLSLIREPKK